MEYLALLTFPDVTIKQSSTVNPEERIQHDFEGTPHDCAADSLTSTKLRPDLLSTPIVGAQGEQFDNGFCHKDHLGNHAGFAVGRQYPEKNAERGGICTRFGDESCTFIPNTKAPDGSLTMAKHGVKPLI